MGTEDEIRYHLHQGISPKTLIEQYNYRKSTVYKVADSIRTYSTNTTPPLWTIGNIRFSKINARYLPGEAIRIDFYLQNQASRDLYLQNIGIQTEWMINQGTWYSNSVNSIIRPKEWRYFSISFPIPNEISLGEYELLFGVEGQYLPAISQERVSTIWSYPQVLHIKHPLTGKKVFLSHSVENKFLVRELEKKLDEYGIETYIGEDIPKPGVLLEEKFKRLIESSSFLIALLTNPAVESPSVRMEIEYARSINKPMILLKDRAVNISSPFEWTEFSSHDPPEHTFQIIMDAIQKVNKTNNDGAIGFAIGIGLLALLAAALSKK